MASLSRRAAAPVPLPRSRPLRRRPSPPPDPGGLARAIQQAVDTTSAGAADRAAADDDAAIDCATNRVTAEFSGVTWSDGELRRAVRGLVGESIRRRRACQCTDQYLRPFKCCAADPPAVGAGFKS